LNDHHKILKKYRKVLDIDQKALDAMLLKVEAETRQLAKTMNITLSNDYSQSDETSHNVDIASEFMTTTGALAAAFTPAKHLSGKPFNAHKLLLAGVQDVTQMLAAEEVRISDLTILILETLYTSMGFRFATICLRDLTTGDYLSRTSVGEDYLTLQRGFHFAGKYEADLFHLAMNNNVDVMISDAMAPQDPQPSPRVASSAITGYRQLDDFAFDNTEKTAGIYLC